MPPNDPDQAMEIPRGTDSAAMATQKMMCANVTARLDIARELLRRTLAVLRYTIENGELIAEIEKFLGGK